MVEFGEWDGSPLSTTSCGYWSAGRLRGLDRTRAGRIVPRSPGEPESHLRPSVRQRMNVGSPLRPPRDVEARRAIAELRGERA